MTSLGFTNPMWMKNRDNYITINWQNIVDEYKYLFHKWNVGFANLQDIDHFAYDFHVREKIAQDLLALKMYDTNSVLHYLPIEVNRFLLYVYYMHIPLCAL